MVAEEVFVNFNIFILLLKSKKVIFKVSSNYPEPGPELQFGFAAQQNRKTYFWLQNTP